MKRGAASLELVAREYKHGRVFARGCFSPPGREARSGRRRESNPRLLALVSTSLRDSRVFRPTDQDRGIAGEERGNNTRKRSELPLAAIAEGFTMVMGRDKAEITGGRLGKKARA